LIPGCWDQCWNVGSAPTPRRIRPRDRVTTRPVSQLFLAISASRYLEKTLRQSRRALELNPGSRWMTLNLAWHLFDARDYDAALEQFARAIELAPDDWSTYGSYSHVLSVLGRTDEALRTLRSAYARDTLSARLSAELAWRLRSARDYDGAIAQFENTLALKPNDGDAYYGLALTYAEKGVYEEALRASQKAVELLDPADDDALLGPAYVYARSGQRAKALELAEQMEERHVDPGWIGTVYAALGETDRAFEWLDRASEVKAWSLPHLKHDPRFDPLRSDPRFAALLKKTGLEE
jgi:adenylate cyclase